MLAVEMKSTDKVDLWRPMESYLNTNFGRDQTQKIKPFIESFNTTRNELMAIQGRGGFENSRMILRKHLAACCTMEKRFPLNETKAGVPLKLAWSDSFRPKTKGVLMSWQFEKACVVYNMGSIYSMMARSADRSSTDGIKDAIKYFQMAAGVFSLLRDQIIGGIGGPTTVDLLDPTISMCISFLLAQAQSCFYEKAVKDRLNRSLLSKLACQVAQFYAAALNFAQQVAGQIDPSWAAHFRLQEQAFLTAAHFQFAMAEKERVEEKSEGFGSLIARLKLATSLCEHAFGIAKANSLSCNLGTLQQTLTAELATLEKNNNIIYLEIVPDPKTLPPLEMIATVRATPVTVQELCEPLESATQAFDRLVPADVRAKADEYTTRCESLVSEVQREVNTCSGAVQKALVDRGLPFSVDSTSGKLPDSVWNKIQQVQLKGGQQGLDHTCSTLQKNTEEARAILASLKEQLEQEAKDDQSGRERFSGSWTRMPSDTLNGNFFNSITQYGTKLQQAETANASVLEKFRSQASMAPLLSKNRSEIEATIPSGKDGAEADSPAKTKVRTALTALEGHMDGLQKEMESFRTTVLADNITSALIEAKQRGEPLERVIDRELVKFQANQQAVSGAIEKANGGRVEVEGAWTAYQAETTHKEDERTQYLKKVESAATAMLEVFSDASEGVGFFTRLLDYLRTLRQQVDDFVYARQEERKDLLGTITRQISGGASGQGN